MNQQVEVTYRGHVRPLWFPNSPHSLVEVEQWELTDLRDKLRDALNHAVRLGAKNRELNVRLSELRGELALRPQGERREASPAGRNRGASGVGHAPVRATPTAF